MKKVGGNITRNEVQSAVQVKLLLQVFRPPFLRQIEIVIAVQIGHQPLQHGNAHRSRIGSHDVHRRCGIGNTRRERRNEFFLCVAVAAGLKEAQLHTEELFRFEVSVKNSIINRVSTGFIRRHVKLVHLGVPMENVNRAVVVIYLGDADFFIFAFRVLRRCNRTGFGRGRLSLGGGVVAGRCRGGCIGILLTGSKNAKHHNQSQQQWNDLFHTHTILFSLFIP